MNPGKIHEVQAVNTAHAGVWQERLKLAYVHHDWGQSKGEAINFVKTWTDTDVQQESLCPGITSVDTDYGAPKRQKKCQCTTAACQQDISFQQWNLPEQSDFGVNWHFWASSRTTQEIRTKCSTDNGIDRHIPAGKQWVLMWFLFSNRSKYSEATKFLSGNTQSPLLNLHFSHFLQSASVVAHKV